MLKRANYYMSQVQLKRLESLSKKMGLSASEILRRAVDEYWERYGKKKTEDLPQLSSAEIFRLHELLKKNPDSSK